MTCLSLALMLGAMVAAISAQCGINNYDTLVNGTDYIVGGENAVRNAWPWQLSIRYKSSGYQHGCGAALIDPYWAVTAAHCVGADLIRTTADVLLQAGAHSTFGDGISLQVQNIYRHEYWRGSSKQVAPHDIAVMRLRTPANTQSRIIGTICMPQQSQQFTNLRAYVTGWGAINGQTKTPPRSLKQLAGSVMPRQSCLPYQPRLAPNDVCFGTTVGMGVCYGDSGGPMSVSYGGRWFLGGVASYTIDKCVGQAPSVYTYVPDYITWMRGKGVPV